ncbi:MAG TPA: hypothetical protein VGA99_10070 [bacterium]
MTRTSKTQNRSPGGGKFLFNVTLLLISAVLTALLAETSLRVIGEKPGYVPRYSRFKFVPRLEVDSSFCTDSEGVFKANPQYPHWTDDIHINTDGFRGEEFSMHVSHHETKILFLGDSFAWGSSARPITKSFVDLVRQRGFVTYNTGVPGTDPYQYAYLAEKYAPRLMPDIVAVMFYLGNDFIAPRPMLPFKNLYHVTNAKFLYAFDEKGNYMSPQQAYQYYAEKNNAANLARHRQEGSLKSRLRNLLMKTVTGTYLWVSVSRIKQGLLADSRGDTTERVYDEVRKSLLRIKSAADNVNARFLLFVIPVHPYRQAPQNRWQFHGDFLHEFHAHIPDLLEKSDYMELPNSHFNNSGHRKYADFILETIDKLEDMNGQTSNGS